MLWRILSPQDSLNSDFKICPQILWHCSLQKLKLKKKRVELNLPCLECVVNLMTHWWMWWYATSESRSPHSLVNGSSLGKPAAGHEGVHAALWIGPMVRNWGLLPTALCMSHLETRPFRPSQAFPWLQPQSTSLLQPKERFWPRPHSKANSWFLILRNC